MEDCEIIEARNRLVSGESRCISLCYAISSGETCSGESRCIFICYKLWRDLLFGRFPVYLVSVAISGVESRENPT